MHISSMRGRMTAAFAAALALLMALVCGGLIWYARFAEERNGDALLRMGVNKVRQEVDEESAPQEASQFVRHQSDDLQKDGLVLSTAAVPGAAVRASQQRYGVSAAMQDLRTVEFTAGAYDLVIGLPWRKTEERLRAQAAALLALSLSGVLIGTAGAWFLVGKTLSPIAILSAEADVAQVDRLRVHLRPPSSDAEIVQLVGTLNHLLDRQSQAASAQARFYAAASHELRTPLHTLSGHLEVGLSRERSNPEYRAAMEEAYRQASRLAALVQDLLLLTRLNTAAASPAKEMVNLPELCERTRHQLSPMIEARGLAVEARYTSEGEICTVSSHAEMVVRNLMENAVNYAVPGGAVTVSIGESDDGLQLNILNDCAPLEITDVRQLLEPFFRPDASRQSETGGNGLGLAICDAIARTNGWGLDVRQETGVFCVDVTFPCSRDTC